LNGDFPVDVDGVLDSLRGAQVVTIFFPILRRSLVIDTRATVEDGPLVRVLPMVSSPEERLRSLKRLRPHLPRPDSVTIIPWPKQVRSLVSLGVWDALAARLATTGHVRSVKALHRAIGNLRRMEEEELRRVISGDTYQTIWRRSR